MAIWSFIAKASSDSGESTTESTSNCQELSVDDGGLTLNFLADLCVTAFILLIAICSWVFYLKKEEKKALAYPHMDAAPSEVFDEVTERGVTEDTKLVWWKCIFQLWMTRSTTIEIKQGIDGVRYIHMEERMMQIMLIVMVLSLCIILPINLTGDNEDTSFGKICITNLDTDSELLWAHFILAPVFLIVILVIVWMYTSELGAIHLQEEEKATIIRGVDESWDKNYYMEYFSRIGMKEYIVDIQLGYDVTKLYSMIKEKAEMNRMQQRYTDLIQEEPGAVQTVNTGSCPCCGCCGEEVNALDHYTKCYYKASIDLEQERVNVSTRRISLVFIVWVTTGHCKLFINMHKAANIFTLLKDPVHHGTAAWQVRKAPVPYDIMWDNMSTNKWMWWLRASIVNIILLILVIFFTTPVIIVIAIYEIFSDGEALSSASTTSFFFVYMIILTLIVLQSILPNIVSWTCKLEKHRTRSGYYHWILKKCFAYLIISCLILPMFGYSSIAMLFDTLMTDDSDAFITLLQCMFTSYNSAFFCNLLMAAALIGRSIELLQLMQLIDYIWCKSESRTTREYALIFKKIKRKFNIGYNYAKFHTNCCIAIVFSLICPLVTVIAMTYLLFKYLVDKYLMVHCTAPCGSYSPATHYTSAYFAVFSGCLLQFFMFVFAVVYIGADAKTLVSGLVLLLILVICLTKVGENFIKFIFPKTPSDKHFLPCDTGEDLKGRYIPAVLLYDEKVHKLHRKNLGYHHSRTSSMTSMTLLLRDNVNTPTYKSIDNFTTKTIERVKSRVSERGMGMSTYLTPDSSLASPALTSQSISPEKSLRSGGSHPPSQAKRKAKRSRAAIPHDDGDGDETSDRGEYSAHSAPARMKKGAHRWAGGRWAKSKDSLDVPERYPLSSLTPSDTGKTSEDSPGLDEEVPGPSSGGEPGWGIPRHT